MATIKLQDLKIGYSDQFFFDTNVWLLLYGTIAGFQESDQKKYSKLLEDLLTQDKPIFLTSMILSEFANVQLRFAFKQWTTANKFFDKDFKRDFIGTTEYKKMVETVSVAIRKILKLPNIYRTGDNFNAIPEESILKNFQLVDFNDAYIVELAKLNKYRIVTNDADFLKLSDKIDIISTRC